MKIKDKIVLFLFISVMVSRWLMYSYMLDTSALYPKFKTQMRAKDYYPSLQKC